MKIYFTASMSGRGKYLKNYKKILSVLKDLGIKVYEETVGVTREYVYDKISDEEKIKYYQKVLKWISDVDIVIVEASHQSLSIGHEISLALERNKPVIVLYSKGDAPHFLVGVKSDKLLVQKYSMNDLKTVIRDSIDYASEQQDTRFNFFISTKHQNYLDWIAKKLKIPRAVHLRALLEKDMAVNKKFQAELTGGDKKKK